MAPRTRTQWLADAGAVVSLLLPALFVTMVVRDQTISAHPETAIAVVEKKSLVDTGGEGPVFPDIGYRFTAASGGTFSGHSYVSQGLFDKLAVGDRVEIQYAADDPSTSHIPGESGEWTFYTFGISVIGGIFFWYLGPRRWLRMWREKDRLVT